MHSALIRLFVIYIFSFKVTPAMIKKISEMDVDTNVKIIAPRNGCLEKYLIQKPTNPVQYPQRRNHRLLSAPIRCLPFGIRGRRRRDRRQSILFIGMRPDVDNVAPPPPAVRPPTPTPNQNILSRPTSPAVIDMSLLESSFSESFGQLSINDSD